MLNRWFGERNGARTRLEPLADAAERVAGLARRERLPLAVVAERAEPKNAPHWFASNILRIVTVQGRRDRSDAREDLTTEKLESLRLDDAMSELRAESETTPRFVDLTISSREYAKYVRWARTVQ